jgi:asparagine synthase (glutamine-hydrolysing)
VTAPYRQCPSANDVQRAQYADLKIYLPNDPLVKVDRTSMANSLEVRCPLLDHRVIEFAFRIPADRKAQPGRSKHFLRALGTRRLPPTLDRLPKRGFTAPVAEWMRQRYRDWFRDEVLSPQAASTAMIDRRVLARWVDEDARGTRNRSAALWSVWCLERWARRLAR